MNANKITKLACLGCGTVGSGWATHFLCQGYDVNLHDVSESMLDKAMASIEGNMKFLASHGIINESHIPNVLKKARRFTDLAVALEGVDYIQESTFESYETKQNLLKAVDAVNKEAIFASSTSGLLMSEIQENSLNPARCITAHPFNPPHLIPLVELVPGKLTSEETVKTTYDFITLIKKVPVIVKKEQVGHISNRLQQALWREGIAMIQDGVCTSDDLDKALCFGPGLRYALMGPNLTAELGGGPDGIDGFFHHFTDYMNLVWSKLHNPTVMPENIVELLKDGVMREMDGKSQKEVIEWRDESLVGILKLLGKL